jgi:hypothetical protein
VWFVVELQRLGRKTKPEARRHGFKPTTTAYEEGVKVKTCEYEIIEDENKPQGTHIFSFNLLVYSNKS